MIYRKPTCLTMKPEDDYLEFEEYQDRKKQGYYDLKKKKVL